MEVQLLKIAGLSYQVPAVIKLASNYLPFILSPSYADKMTSVLTTGEVIVSKKELLHKGLAIDNEKELCIYGVNGNGYYVNLSTKGSHTVYELYASPRWDKIILSNNCIMSSCPGSVIDIFMMLIFIYSSAFFNTVLLHSSCIKRGDDAVAFIGESGAGKSTHSQLWLTHITGTKLLNDDQPAVRVHDNGSIIIYGTPWSGKAPCYINEKAVLQGIIRMKQAPENNIIPLSPISLFQELLAACSMLKTDIETFKLITSTLAKISSSTSGFIFENRPEKKAVMIAFTNTLKRFSTN